MFGRKEKDFGLLILRLGIGAIFIYHGMAKLIGGMQTWTFLGKQMSNLGITFWPAAWGFAAACSEFFGGICLVLGLMTRLASLLMAFTMFVATLMHATNVDSWKVLSHPLSLFVVFAALFVSGPGVFSVDYFFHKK